MFIWLIVYFAFHHMSEWIHVQTLQQAVSSLAAANILLELPLRMFPSKHEASHLEDIIKTDCLE